MIKKIEFCTEARIIGEAATVEFDGTHANDDGTS